MVRSNRRPTPQANAQILYAEGIEMSLEQLRGGEPGTASSREELSVLRGVAEELGLLGGAEAVRNFAAAFGVKQVTGSSACYFVGEAIVSSGCGFTGAENLVLIVSCCLGGST